MDNLPDFRGIWGSSRRAPGQRRELAALGPEQGFIPACAGAARARARTARTARVHPGVRRGSSLPEVEALLMVGSSRRAPGQRDADRLCDHADGFIPACAGAAPSRCRSSDWRWVHPGVRRGSATAVGFTPPHLGSSRRAPGQHRHRQQEQQEVGFIPACAGAATVAASVHGSADGSSRRAPGQPSRVCDAANPGWFIPACAGAAGSQ